MNPYINFSVDSSGVAVIVLNSTETRLNILSTPFMDALDQTLNVLGSTPGVRAAVITSGKSEGFIAGANLQELSALQTLEEAYEKTRQGQLIFQKLADLPFPTTAAISGHCMGGGTELILACDFRLAAAKSARIALPEIRLGLFPGWGGTQRLPRLIGLRSALDMMLTGKTYSAYQACRCGLVDKEVPDLVLHRYAIDFARKIAKNGSRKYIASRKKKTRNMMSVILEKNLFGRFFLLSLAAWQIVKRTGRNYPAPFMTLKVLQWSLSKPFAEGLKVEARGFARLIPTPEHKNLLHIFHLSQRPKKQFSVLPDSKDVASLKIGIVGAGVMGGGIVHLFADKNYPVRMKDIQSPMIISGLKTADTLFDYSVKQHRITRLEKQRKLENISSTLSYDGFDRLDVVIEAVAEKMAVKRQVLKEIEEIVPERTVFASNTSALSISELQSSARFPNRVCGMHFFNPVHRMPLVEVIKGSKTDEHTTAVIFNLSKSLGKIPILVQDSPGFLVNRLLGVYINEACVLVQEGCDVQWLDTIVEKFGMPMGPFRLIDEVGIDIAAEVGAILGKAFEDRLKPSPLLKRIKSLGFQGKKTGKGFYRYSNGKRKGFNRGIKQLLPVNQKHRSDDALERMMFLMVNEAAASLRQGVVSSPEDVDTAMVFGAGFPPFRGGLCRWADTRGLKSIANALKQHESTLGPRYAPDPFLQTETRFYKTG